MAPLAPAPTAHRPLPTCAPTDQVDCGSGAPLPAVPGYIAKKLYADGMAGEGWTWFVQKEVESPR